MANAINFIPPTASFAGNAGISQFVSASGVVGTVATATTSSYSLTASYNLQGVSASYSNTSSLSILSTTTSFVSAVNVNGTVNSSFTSSLSNTASYALTASYNLQGVSSSYATTASFVNNPTAISSSYAATSSVALISLNSVSSSYALSASVTTTCISSSLASFAISAGHAFNADNAGFSTTAGTASLVLAGNIIGTVNSSSYSVTSSFSQQSNNSFSSSYATTASFAIVSATSAASSSFANTASVSLTSLTTSFVNANNVKGNVATSSVALFALSASTSLFSNNAQNAQVASNAANAATASYLTDGFDFVQVTGGGLLMQGRYGDNINILSSSITATDSFGDFIQLTQGTITIGADTVDMSGETINFDSSIVNIPNGKLTSPNTTGSLFGTASWANNSLMSNTASFLTASNLKGLVPSSSFAFTSSFAQTASFYSGSISNALTSTTASYALTASKVTTSSFALTVPSSLALSNLTVNSSTTLAGLDVIGASVFDNGAMTTDGSGNLNLSGVGSGGNWEISQNGTVAFANISSDSSGNLTVGSLSSNGTISVDGGLLSTDGNGDLTVSNLLVNNQISASGITASLFGTSSRAIRATTSSYVTDGIDYLKMANGNVQLFDGSGDNLQLNSSSVQLASVSGSSIILTNTVNISGKTGLGVTTPINTLDVAGNISCSVITASIFYTISRSLAPVSSSGASSSSYSINFDRPYHVITGSTATMSFVTVFNAAAVKSTVIYIVAPTASLSMSFNNSWSFLGSIPPTTLSASKAGVLSLTAMGSTDNAILATWTNQL